MATLSHSESRRLYSWWWDSHVSPKNSKWLQENLTDMNAKVKTMIKLIEEDADSFAKRAEMYYKKRPELMKLVEDFYRAYRALAERYDHATGALRQAHRTMAEAFPNQVPFALADDSSPGSSGSEIGPHSPETPHPLRAMLDPDDLHKDTLGLSSSHFHAIKRNAAHSNESDSVTSKKGLKQLNELVGSEEGAPHHMKLAEGGMRKGPSYHKGERNHSEHETHIGYGNQSNHGMKENLMTRIKSSSERGYKVETEVQALKDALAKLEDEKEVGLLQHQHALERLSNLEAEVSRAQEDARGFNVRASKAETEVQTLNEALIKLQAEKEDGLLQYQQCMERMSNLENKISHVQEHATSNIETEVQSLKQVLARVEAEKEASLLQYTQCLEKISNLETKVSLAEENARNLNERAVRAETEVKFLKEAIAKLDEEKEAAALQYQRSLETISALQSEVSHVQEEATRLSSVIVMGVAKLSSIEEQYLQLERENQSLQTEIDTLEEMMTLQKQELSEKLEELERLESCIEEEYIHSTEAEAAVQTLQNLHSECPEEREALALEVQNGAKRLKDKELEYQGLEEETRHVKEQNNILNKQNGLLAITEKSLQDEIFRLREAEVKLEKEIEVLVDQKKALQQEIYILKEELDDLKKRHLNVIEQMELVGLKPDCLGLSVKSLYDENSRLKEICQKDSNEKESLSEKLKNMENILEKNALLENSLLDLNAGLELFRAKVKTLEETCQSLKQVNTTVLDEKESLVSRLEMANRNVERLSEKNTFLVNFLFDADVERAWLREKAKCLEEFCQSLDDENRDLFTAKDSLVSQFENIQQKLGVLVREYTNLEGNHSCLEKEMESKIHLVEELQATLNLEKQEHASFIHSSEIQLAHLEGDNHVLQEEGKRRLKEFENEQDTTVKAQLEIFILQRFIRDLKERNLSLFTEYQNHLEASKLSQNLVTNLERENFEQQVKINSLSGRVERLRFGIRQMALSLKIDPAYECPAEIEEDQLLHMAMGKIEDLESSLWSAEDERQHLLFEKSVFLTLLVQLRLEAVSIESKRSSLHKDLMLRTDDLLLLQSERNKLQSATDNLYHQIEIGKDILSQKEMELSETKQKLKAVESENMELNSKLRDMNSNCEEDNLTREVLEKQILNISESNSHKSKEIECLHEVTEKLDLELKRLHEEIKEQRVKEDNLSSELQLKRNEIKLWEYEAETMYCNCQVTDIHAALFKEKVHELVGACESLGDERDSKTEDIEQLKERIHMLELENKGVKSELAAYLPVVVSLRECVTTLEDHVIPQTKNYEADNPEKEVADVAPHQHDSNKELTENQSLLVADGVLNLLELQARIKKIETSVVEQKRLIIQESFNKNIKLDAAMRKIQKLEQLGNGSSNRTEPDFSDVGIEILVKDIPLDQVSQCSSKDHGIVPQAIMNKREDAEMKEEILELWDIVEQDLHLNLTFNQDKKLAAVPTQEIKTVEEKSECFSSEIQSEEMSVASESLTVPQEKNKRKILERLASDAQKLMNLQLTIQDLRKKADQLEKYVKPKDTEFATVKGELKEVEEAIMQLVGTNDKLAKKAEKHPVASDGTLIVELVEETGKARRCRISERARRASEKIGRLHLEVQRIQFVLLKLEDRYKGKGTDRKVLLKDYLYGNLRSPRINKRKKSLFFSCVKPPTSLD